MTTDTNPASARDLRSATDGNAIFEARDKLTRIKDLNEIMFMAGEGLVISNRSAGNAITGLCDTIKDMLNDVCELMDGGAA